ncbi:hypothetical protein MYBA111488_24680 [Mycobacterium basiliense]
MQRHSAPGERQQRLIGVGVVGNGRGVQHGIEHRGMNPEFVDLDINILGDGDLGKYFLVAPPHRGQTSKRRPVVIPSLRQPRVGIGDIEGHRIRGRPHRQIRASRYRLHHYRGLGVQHPFGIRLLAARVHRHRAPAQLAGGAYHYLHLHSPTGRKQQGCGQH